MNLDFTVQLLGGHAAVVVVKEDLEENASLCIVVCLPYPSSRKELVSQRRSTSPVLTDRSSDKILRQHGNAQGRESMYHGKNG